MKATQTASIRAARRPASLQPPAAASAAKPVRPAAAAEPRPSKRVQQPPKSTPEPDDLPKELTAEAAPRWPYIVLLLVGVVILGATSALALGRTLTGWEHSLFVAINGAHLPGWVAGDIAKPLSNAVWGILGLIVGFLLVPKYRLLAWQYLAAGVSAYILTTIVEHVVDRARPMGLTHDVILRASQDGPGFTSGHVGVLAAVCGAIWLFVSWPWRILLVLFVAAEAWSRLYLGVHAPLDVIGAIGVAFIVIAVLHLLPQRLKTFFRLHR